MCTAEAQSEELPSHLERPRERAEGPARALELARRLRAGDRAALQELLVTHGALLRRIVRVRALARLRALLASAEPPPGFREACERQFRSSDPESAAEVLEWIARLAEAWMGAERERPRRAHGADSGILRLVFGDRPGNMTSTSRAAHAALRAEFEELVDSQVETLEPAELREVLLLRDYLGMSWEAIQSALGRPSPEETRALYRNAHDELKRRMRPYLERRPPGPEPRG